MAIRVQLYRTGTGARGARLTAVHQWMSARGMQEAVLAELDLGDVEPLSPREALRNALEELTRALDSPELAGS